MAKKRINVGLFTGNITDSFDDMICQGAIRAAEEMDVNLIIVPGNYLDLNRESELGLMYEYQANTLFSFGDPEAIDVLLVCLSSIGCLTTKKRRREFLKSINKVPVVTIASCEEGYSSVVYDNHSGLREAMEYLIKNCKKKKIAMLSGPPDNSDFGLRLATFKELMEENGLQLHENSIIYGDASYRSVRAAEEILDHNPGVEAIVCGNDAMAQALYEVCRKRGIIIGKDILITGFDDVVESRRLNPPLASVRTNMNSMGYHAVLMGLRLLETGVVENKVLPTHFIKRESVNYYAEDVRHKIRNAICSDYDEKQRRDLADTVLDYISFSQFGESKREKLGNEICACMDYIHEIDSEKKTAEEMLLGVLGISQKIFTEKTMANFDRHRLLQLFTILLQEVPFCNKSETYKRVLLKAITIEQKYVTDYLMHTSLRTEKKQSEITHNTNIMARDMLMSDSLGERSFQTILTNLPMLNIEHSFLYTYETPIQHIFREEWVRPEHILLKAYQKNDQANSIPRTKQKMKCSEVFRNEFIDDGVRHTWVMHDIYSCDWQYGVFICDLKHEDFNLHEFLTYQISSCVRTINLFQKEVEMQKELEETLEQLKLNNIQLDRISKFDELTGILNRRGFIEEAENLLKNAEDKDVLVLYADLDSLKLINDTFGHEEGDFAIRSEAQILSAILYKDGVFGRLGGDEFAGIIPADDEVTIESLRTRLENTTKDFNQNAGKPYRVQISVGIDRITYRKGMSLTDMLSQADDLLYKEKKNKKDILEFDTGSSLDEQEIEMLIMNQFGTSF